jgi:hypothetical protein
MRARIQTVLRFYEVMTVTMMFYLYDSQWKNVSNKPAEMNRNSKDEILRPVTEYGRPDGIHNKDIRNT